MNDYLIIDYYLIEWLFNWMIIIDYSVATN